MHPSVFLVQHFPSQYLYSAVFKSVFIDSSKKEEARSMWLLLPLCHFSILGTRPFKMKSTSWKLIQFQNLFFPQQLYFEPLKSDQVRGRIPQRFMTTTCGYLLARKGPGGGHLLIFVYRHFLFVYSVYVYIHITYEKRIWSIILNWTRGGFCEGSHLLSRDWLPLRGRDTVHSWRDVWLRWVTERGVQHRWNWWQNKVSTLRTMTDMKTGMSK